MLRLFRIYRGTDQEGKYFDFEIEVDPGMVVLDAVHKIQGKHALDLAVRWNCKAGKCGSCSAEVNGHPVLMCMTKIDSLPKDQPIIIQPLKAFPIEKDLVTDVSWNYEQNKKIPPFTPCAKCRDKKKQESSKKIDDNWKFYQRDVIRSQEFRKCIECFLCQDVCHVLRTHKKHDSFFGPRFFARIASLEMHPLDQADRIDLLHQKAGLGFCNITKCCSEVCPEKIRITDNAIIPLKERVCDRFYDPVKWIFRKIFKNEK